MADTSLCVVFVCNKNYFQNFLHTCKQLVTNGKYTGEICLVIGDDLKDDDLLHHQFIEKHNIIIKHFPEVVMTGEALNLNMTIDGHLQSNLTKRFQWHKLHLFNSYFKRWRYIFYIDCGVHIFSDVGPILRAVKRNKLVAHSDAYPTYEWKLHNQFDKGAKECYAQLEQDFDLEVDYFQTTIMLYDTRIIQDNTFDNLYKLMLKYPITRKNDQLIFALYFTSVVPVFEQIQIKHDDTYFYDYLSRNHGVNKYIMLKMHW